MARQKQWQPVLHAGRTVNFVPTVLEQDLNSSAWPTTATITTTATENYVVDPQCVCVCLLQQKSCQDIHRHIVDGSA